ncbi:hypothetical protein AK812_SmicGene35087 [Symbiodinium microadriaticum]|uniref:Uncharacterized protein n=1 Tax=Symbiodinium microadriaticum TaxID=2951 RepID=A0A1Q9CMC6_SYMMI|nr:hypothetical protein AK812_SmicGene35087 [Symbiodinium microadriaticum]
MAVTVLPHDVMLDNEAKLHLTLQQYAFLLERLNLNVVAELPKTGSFTWVEALARNLKEEADLCKVQTESDRVSALRAEVKTYEQRLKEALERKVLAEAEVMAAKIAQAAEEEEENKEEEEDETRNFIMMTGSDDEQEEYDEEEEARVLNDLELSYEGLELSSIMPVPAAVRLATGHISHQDTMSKADIPETGFLEREGVEFGRWTRPSPSGNKDWTEEELEAEYGEHLRNLEKVLLELRQEQAEQAEERRCQSRLAALKQKKRQEAAAAAAAAAVAGNRFRWSLGNWLRSEKAEVRSRSRSRRQTQRKKSATRSKKKQRSLGRIICKRSLDKKCFVKLEDGCRYPPDERAIYNWCNMVYPAWCVFLWTDDEKKNASLPRFIALQEMD